MDSIVCCSLTELKSKVDIVIKEEGFESLNFPTVLNKCIETLELFNQQSLVIKASRVDTEEQRQELKLAYERSYIYYKIVTKLCTNIIPENENFKTQHVLSKPSSLLDIFNSIIKKLGDLQPKFLLIKEFLKKHSPSQQLKKQLDQQISSINSGKDYHISSRMLHHIIHSPLWKDDTLLVDIRPKLDFEQLHVKFKNCICIEPISFKDNYTDQDIIERSMITSSAQDLKLFQSRHLQKIIVLYTSTRIEHYKTQVNVFRNILLKKSFEKPLDLGKTKLLVLSEGLEQWVALYGLENCKVGEPSKNGNSALRNNLNFNTHSPSPSPVTLPLTQLKLSTFNKQDLNPATSMMTPESSTETTQDGYLTQVLSTPVTYSNSNLQSIKSAFFNSNSPRSSPAPMYTLPNFQQQQQQQHHHHQQQQQQQQEQPALARSSSFKKRFSYMLGKDSSASEVQSTTSTPSLVDLVAKYPETPVLSSPSLTPHSQPPAVSPSALSKMFQTAKGASQPMDMASSSTPNVYSPVNSLVKNASVSLHQAVSSPVLQPSQTHAIKQEPDFTTGLVNLGNSCYMNCIIQCLLGTKELTQIFLNDKYKDFINLNSKLGSKGLLANYFSQLVHKMYANKNSVVQPANFKAACGSVSSIFKNNEQQDCQEFVQFLLDGLHEDLNQCGQNPAQKELSEENELKREKLPMRLASSVEWERYLKTDFSVILEFFQGQYSSRLQCKVCTRTSTTYQPFSVISVPVPPHGTNINKINLYDCFKEFTKVENLGKEEYWNCPHCKKKQPSTKKITITRLPRNLIIHLKRFDNSMNKNNEFIYYPHVLDLTSFWLDNNPAYIHVKDSDWPANLSSRGQVPPFKYTLYAVANHSGTLYGGHYTAFVKKQQSLGQPAKWYSFDDSNVKVMKNENEVIASSAYVLFYKKIYT